MKIISKDDLMQEAEKRIKNEIEVLKTLDHPNILKVYEFLDNENYYYVVEELCTGGELFERITKKKSFTERDAFQIMQQILSAIAYCHMHNVCHRDLKPEHILFETPSEESPIKIIDFGTSAINDKALKKKQAKLQSPLYIAPEAIQGKWSTKCDVWSCGVILHIMLTGNPPFNGPTENAILSEVINKQLTFAEPEWESVTTEAKQFIAKLLEKDPKKRYSSTSANLDPWMKMFMMRDPNQLITGNLQNAFTNLQKFQTTKKFQEAVLVFFVNNLVSNEEKQNLLKAFRELDSNNDGILSKDELLFGYKKIMNDEEAEKQVSQIFANLDKNGNGSIDYNEFVMATINMKDLLSKERLKLAFRMMDLNGDGTIQKSELRVFFSGIQNMNENVFKELISEVDENGDGEISFDEFCTIMQQCITGGETKEVKKEDMRNSEVNGQQKKPQVQAQMAPVPEIKKTRDEKKQSFKEDEMNGKGVKEGDQRKRKHHGENTTPEESDTPRETVNHDDRKQKSSKGEKSNHNTGLEKKETTKDGSRHQKKEKPTGSVV